MAHSQQSYFGNRTRGVNPGMRNPVMGKALVALAGLIMALTTMQPAHAGTVALYDFESFYNISDGGTGNRDGNLQGLDGWVDPDRDMEFRNIHKGGSSVQVITGKTNRVSTGANDTANQIFAGRKNGTYTGSPGSNAEAVGTDFNYDLSIGTSAIFSFVARDDKAQWFALGQDTGGDGDPTTPDDVLATAETTLWFGTKGNDGTGNYFAEIGTGGFDTHTAVATSTTNAGSYNQFRLEVDFGANSGAGSATLYGLDNTGALYGAAVIGDETQDAVTDLGMIELLADVNLGLPPDAYKTWDGIGIAGQAWGGVDELTVTTVVPIAMVWRADSPGAGDWGEANWLDDGALPLVSPIADKNMIVNSGIATVTAAPATPIPIAAALDVIGLETALDAVPTVVIDSGASLTVTGAVNVGDRGTLNVNGTMTAGEVNCLNVEVGGRLTLGGGARILSPLTVATGGDATITVGGTLVGGSDATAGIGAMGDDDGTLNLILTGTSTYEVTCIETLDDENNPIVLDTSIDVTGKLTMESGATINLTLGSGDITDQTVMLFRSYYDDFDIGGVTTDLGDLSAAGINLTSNGEALVGATLAWSEYIYDGILDAEFKYLTLTGVTLSDTLLGDANGDTFVNDADMTILLAQFGSASDRDTTAGDADFNGDGLVNLADFVILRTNWGEGTAPDAVALPNINTPEPATLILMAAGLPALLKRRRRK
ncbi:MAG: PEP-CTERM sorting domain-containing protein [Phycisphaerales bacterium]|jgi:hypothetical protein|nr:PEP-CTERM sorting domain-containing protein [Phycisphaerales bacterium]